MGVEKMKSVLSAMAVSAALLASLPAWAASLTIDGTTGTWTNPVTTSGPTGPLAGTGGSTISWGVPALGTKLQSSYGYANTGSVTQTSAGSFLIGQFTHTNGTIWASSTQLHTADLNVSVSGTADGQAFSLSSSFAFSHDETLNEASTCAGGGPRPCGDTVGISLLTGAPLVITQGNTIFTIVIDGFVQSLGGSVISAFLTPELAKTPLYLQASLSMTTLPPPPPPPPASVPVPPAGMALVAALGALGALRARRHRR